MSQVPLPVRLAEHALREAFEAKNFQANLITTSQLTSVVTELGSSLKLSDTDVRRMLYAAPVARKSLGLVSRRAVSE